MLRFVVLASFITLALGFPHSGGLPKLDGRIVGGKDADIKKVPYQISLQYLRHHICGGSIISSKYVVTAAHCTDGSAAEKLSIRYGSSQHASGGNVVQVAKIFQNPKFNMIDLDSDISILELSDDLQFGVGAKNVDLPVSEAEEGDPTICTGWGVTSEGGILSPTLKQVIIPIVSREKCEAAYGAGKITANMICAGFLGIGGQDACQGDSGGPLVSGGDLVGIVSWGYGCADPSYPGVFSNVATLRDYIREKTGI